MTPRRVLFWIHLSAGCVAGIVILTLSITGILLAYKRQVMAWSDQRFLQEPVSGGQRLPLETLLSAVRDQSQQSPTGITVRADPRAPVAFDFGRERTIFVDPYSGHILGEQSPRLRKFFADIEGIHRWLGASTENRATGRAITGACTLAFLLLVMSGPFLWWPKQWNRNNLRKITLPVAGAWNRARDWNWHNTLGIWCFVPLAVIVVSGVIMSYTWANNLLYRISGSEPPTPTSELRPQERNTNTQDVVIDNLSYLFDVATQQEPDWVSASLRLPAGRSNSLIFSLDRGDGGRPDLRSQVTLDAITGAVKRHETFANSSRGRQWRSWVRFTHTGEAFGVFGETIAAMASAAASLLVFTGISLAVRRLAAWKSRRQERLASVAVPASSR